MLVSYFIFFLLLGVIKTIFPEFDIAQYEQSDLNELLEKNPLKFIFLAVILAPVVEEGMFRTLIKPSSNEIIFFLTIWILVLVSAFIPFNVFWMLKYLFLILLGVLSFIFLKQIIPDQFLQKLCNFLGRYYIYIWLLTSLIFGLVHIFNYVDGFEINLVLFLLVAPRVIAGFFFGKTKIENNGLFWPILMHCMNNGTVVIFLLPKLLFSI
jgi:membrane protease YdiL (CAAX protease family)